MNHLKTGLAAVLISAGAFTLTACGSTAIPDTINVQNVENNVISVSSREQVKVEPDIAEIIYSVYSQASDAPTCQTQNNSDLDKVLTMLKEQGVEEKSIQTSNYGMSPIYNWEDGKTVSGYEMTTQVTVSDIPIDQVGQLISESVDAGVNSIDSVNYMSSKYNEAYQQALAKAIDAAKVKAQAMADAGGCKLGKIANIREYGDNQSVRYNGYSSGAGAAAKEAAMMDMGVMPGEVEIEANIAVDFSID